MKTLNNHIRQFICILILCFCAANIYGENSKYIRECKIEKQNGKYGITFQGQQLVPFEYDKITPCKDRYYKVQQNNLFGICTPVFLDKKQIENYNVRYPVVEINVSGNNKYIYIANTVECVYDAIEDFDNDYILLKKNEKIGLVNQYGSTVIPCQFDKIERNSTYLYVTNNKKQGIFNRYGSTILPCRYDEIQKINNRYYVKINGKQGIFNQYGSTIIPANYTEILETDNKFLVQNGDKEGIFNQYGSTIIPCKYDDIRKEGNFYYVYNEGKQGILNQYGSTIIPCKYDDIKQTGKKYCVKNDNLYGIFNEYGSTILPCKYNKIDFLANGQYITYNEGKKQLYNAHGSFISDYSENNVIYSTSSEEK